MIDLKTKATRLAVVAVVGFVPLPIAFDAAPVLAQTAEEDAVLSRSRPDFDAIGIELDEFLGIVGLVSDKTIEQKSSPLSSFVVRPSLGVTGVYDNNIFLTENSTVSDKRVEYAPALVIQSDWGRHELSFSATSTIGRYVENTGENYEDYQLQTNGRLDIHDNKKLDVVLGIAQRHEERNEEDDLGQGFEPIVSFNRFADLTDAFLFRPSFNYEHRDFQDSGAVSNDGRDETIIDMSVRLGFDLSPGSTIFIKPNADFRLFDLARDTAGFLQDNNAIGMLAGLTWDITGVTFLEVGAGFTYREYDDPRFSSELNFDYSLKGIWNATDVLTATAELTRSFADSATAGESGSLNDSAEFSLDYEFLDNVIISSGLALAMSNTDQSGREDFTVDPTLAVRYLVNENWDAALNLGYSIRESNFTGESYRNFTAGFGLVGKL